MKAFFDEACELHSRYAEKFKAKKLSKTALCELCIPFRDKYKISDVETLRIARAELSMSEMLELQKNVQRKIIGNFAAIPDLQEICRDAALRVQEASNSDLPVQMSVFAVFPQYWGNSCGGIDINDAGKSLVGMDICIESYTEVVKEISSDKYFVYFGGEFGYCVTEPNQMFFDDIRNRTIKPRSKKNQY